VYLIFCGDGHAETDMNKRLIALSLSLLVSSLAVSFVQAQQITGTPGAPSATTTIDGKQLPPPDPKFGGVIKDGALQSKPWWAPRVVPPKGAPNVLLIITDDAGFGVRWTALRTQACATTECSPPRSAHPRAPH
jgi:arylsulfatase